MSVDYTLDYLKKNDIPVTRENYVALNWMGDYSADKPLPAELEASLPASLQLKTPEPKSQEDQALEDGAMKGL